MTDTEYQEFASKAVVDFDQYQDKLKSKTNDTAITNIGEVFLVKIKEGLAQLDSSTFPHQGADKINKIYLSSLNKKNDDVVECVGYLPLSEKSNIICDYYIFTGVRLAIKNHASPEYMLLNLGLENPQRWISDIKYIESIDTRDEFICFISWLHDDLEDALGFEKLKSFFFWGVVSSFGKNIIYFSKKVSTEDFIVALKALKYLVEESNSVYKERLVFILSKVKAISNGEVQNVEEFFPEVLIDLFINNIHQIKDTDELDTIICGKDYEGILNSLTLDILFLLYYYIYDNPQHIVNIGFYLMSEKVTNNISSAIFSSFRKPDYAGLIQYEYEWWCKEKNRKLPLVFPFFEGNLNLENIHIIDYNLNTDKKLKIVSKGENLQQLTNLSEMQKDNLLCDIDNQLCKYYAIFDNTVGHTPGAFFRKHHLHNLVKYSESINDSYSLHGFAYILFKSHYFNWGRIKFDYNFVFCIKKIFKINDSCDVTYNESKSKDKAWKILQDESTPISVSLLSNEEIKRMKPVK